MPGPTGATIRFKPDHKRILECILWLATERPRIDKYTLLKLMFLADKAHVNKHGRPVSSDNYVAMEYGPVPSETYRLLRREYAALSKLGAEARSFSLERDNTGKENLVIAERVPNVKAFSKSDIQAMSETLAKYGAWPFSRLKAFTHADPAYKAAWAKRGTKRSSPIDYTLMLNPGTTTDSRIETLDYISKNALV